MNLKEKFDDFLIIAKLLNEIGIIPILYGSLGLYKLIGQLDPIDDIDIIIPNEVLMNNFQKLLDVMSKIGYTQDVNYPHEIVNSNKHVGFEPESELAEYNIDPQKLDVIELNGAKFKELRVQDYLYFYQSNLKKIKRKEQKINNKICAIRNFLK